MVTVPEGAYATLSARDGLPQPDGQAAAPNWSQSEAGKMLDAAYFLNEGKGVKGPQSAILKPATYPINTYLWDVNTTAGTRTEISTGFVGTVRSAVEDNTVPEFFKAKAGKETQSCGVVREAKAGTLKARLVNVGCLGVWAEALPAGSYFINTNVYEVTEVDVRMQTSEYKGGYSLPDPEEEIERPTAELLIARKREQLAGQQERAFNQIRKAEIARQASEAERELANKQSEIVAAIVKVQVAEQVKQEKLLLGQAQRAFDEEAAQGRKAQALVLGEDRVAMLQALEMGLNAVGENPNLLKVLPEGFSTLIVGGNNDGGLTNLGAMLKEIGGLPTAPRSGATTLNE